jgi:hypothetical protein
MPPIPLSAMLCGLPTASSLVLTLAERVPLAEGPEVKLKALFAPAASVLGLIGQIDVSAKSPGSVPASVMPVIDHAAVPVLLNMTDCGELVVPTFWLPKTTLVGLSVTIRAGVTPVPVTVYSADRWRCGLPSLQPEGNRRCA